MSSCVNSVSHFCGSWETVGLDGVLISISTSGDAASSSTFLSLSRLPCLLLCLLTLRDRRRETWLSPPHFSNARAISKRPVGKFHYILISKWKWDEVTAMSCNKLHPSFFLRLESEWNYGLLLEAIKSKVWRVSRLTCTFKWLSAGHKWRVHSPAPLKFTYLH